METLLSICIPSYNRGERAYKLVCELLSITRKYEDKIEIIVSNNGSEIGTEYYDQIEKISDMRVKYNRFDENRYFVGNFNQVIKMAKGMFCMLLSDEDHLEESALEYYISKLSGDWLDTAVIRAMTSDFYRNMIAGEFSAGPEALEKYFMLGNYISGIVYNRKYLTDELIDSLADDNSDSSKYGYNAYFYYPHMVVDGLLLSKHKLVVDSKVLILEGEDAGDVPLSNEVVVKLYATIAQRLDQMKGFIDFAVKQENDEIILSMTKNILLSTVLLIKHVRVSYEKAGESWYELVQKAMSEMYEILQNCGRETISRNTNAFVDWARELLGYTFDEKAVILMPYREGGALLPDVFWGTLTDILKLYGFRVYTYSPLKMAIAKTEVIDVDQEAIVDCCSKVALTIGVRNEVSSKLQCSEGSLITIYTSQEDYENENLEQICTRSDSVGVLYDQNLDNLMKNILEIIGIS